MLEKEDFAYEGREGKTSHSEKDDYSLLQMVSYSPAVKGGENVSGGFGKETP